MSLKDCIRNRALSAINLGMVSSGKVSALSWTIFIWNLFYTIYNPTLLFWAKFTRSFCYFDHLSTEKFIYLHWLTKRGIFLLHKMYKMGSLNEKNVIIQKNLNRIASRNWAFQFFSNSIQFLWDQSILKNKNKIKVCIIIKRVSWFKSSLLLRIQSDSFTNINS